MSFLAIWWRRIYHSIFTRSLLILFIVTAVINSWRVSESNRFLTHEMTVTATAQQVAVAHEVAKIIAHQVALRQSTLRKLANALPPQLLDRPEALGDWLQARQLLLAQLFDALVVEREDDTPIATYPRGSTNFQSAKFDGAATVQVGFVDQNPALSVREALRHVNGHRGVRLRGLSKWATPGFLESLSAHGNGQSGGTILLLTRERLFLVLSDPAARLQPLPTRGTNALLDLAIAGSQPSGPSVNPQGQNVLAGVAVVPGLAWSVLAYMPTEEAFLLLDHWREFVRERLPYVFLYFIVLVVTGTYFVLRPAWRTARLADQMSRGETPLVRLPIARPDEIGRLTAAFNRLLDRLEGQSLELTLQKERAETADLAKSRFLAAASHDLRQPMHALNLYLGALSHFELPATALPVMASARECAQTMDDMFRALLDISQLDASAMHANISTFAVAPLLENIKNNYIQQAHAKGLVLRVAPCSAYVTSDPELLERVLSNLVSNAVRYTEKGKVLLGCRRSKTGLRMGVYDTGIGIAVDQQRAVFEEFYQVGNSGRDRTQGLGLGLAIVQRLAVLLQAPLTLTSQPGRGSVFAIEVPLAQHKPTARLAAPANFSRQEGSFKGALIAVIDDEPLIREATALVMRQWGCVVVSAASGVEAIERLSQCDRVPEAIVCDHRLLDGETGVDVIAALRTEFNSDIPAILITGDTSPERIQSLQATGIPVLHKPLQDHVLMDALLRLLNHLPMACCGGKNCTDYAKHPLASTLR